MNIRELSIEKLQNDQDVILTCNGNSMRPFMEPKDKLYIKKIDKSLLHVNDIVFCRINKSLQVHQISAINGERFQISNARGHVNGWIGANSIYGICIKVNDKELVNLESRKV